MRTSSRCLTSLMGVMVPATGVGGSSSSENSAAAGLLPFLGDRWTLTTAGAPFLWTSRTTVVFLVRRRRTDRVRRVYRVTERASSYPGRSTYRRMETEREVRAMAGRWWWRIRRNRR